MQHDLAAMRSAAMFDQKDALPCSERRRAADDGNGEMRLGERRANMRGHIVRTFGVVDAAAVFRPQQRGGLGLDGMGAAGPRNKRKESACGCPAHLARGIVTEWRRPCVALAKQGLRERGE